VASDPSPMPEPIRKLPSVEGAPARAPMSLRGGPPQGALAWRNGPPTPPPGVASGPDLPGLLKGLRRRWMLAVTLGFLFAGGAAAVLFMVLTPKYTASSQVLIGPQVPVFKGEFDPSGREFSTFFKTQVGRIKSRFVLNAALKKEGIASLPVIQEQPEPIPFLEDALTVETAENSPYVTLTMMGTDPGAITAIVKAVVDAYLDEVVRADLKRKGERLAELDKVRTQLEEKLRLKKETFRRLADQLGSLDKDVITQKHINLLATYTDLSKQCNTMKFETMRAEGRLKAHKNRRVELDKMPIPEATLNDAIQGNPRVKEMVLRANALALILDAYQKGAAYPEKEPNFQIVKQQQDALRKEMDPVVGKLRTEAIGQLRLKMVGDHEVEQAKLEKELEVILGQREAIQTELDKIRDSAEKLGNSSTELEMLRADIQQEDRLLSSIKEQQQSLQIELNAPQRVSLAQEAGINKKDMKKLLAAMVVGPMAIFVATCFGIAWLEFRGRRIQTAEEVIAGLGMRVVGSLPVLAKPAQRRLLATGETVDGPDHTVIESVDAIRTMLLRDASVEATRVVMVSSAVAGEGKTTLASQLAGSLARAGRKTLLIDCDFRRPAVHQLFEQPNTPGFAEVLLDEVHLAEATRSTPLDGLWMIPAGHWDREVMDALARDGLEEIFDKLKADYDFIIVDSHPVLLATDALLVGQYADAVLLSLLRDVSQAPRVYAACQRLGALGIRVLGAVVHGMAGEDYFAGGYTKRIPAGAVQ
jgi:polysaccharide biosynthesis transport protein